MALDLHLGWGQRYADGESERLEDVSDPHTEGDESSRSLGARVAQYRWFVFAAAGAVVFGTIWLGFFVTSFFPALLSSTWTYIAVGAGGVFLVGRATGWSAHKSQTQDTAKLVLVSANRTRRFYGEYLPNEGEAPWFKPYKGLRGPWLFSRQEPYRIGDIADDVATLRARPDTSADDPALIRLDQGARADSNLLWTVDTDNGPIVVVLTGELEATPGAHQTLLRTTIPAVAFEEQLADLESALEEAQERYQQAEQKRQVMKEQRDDALDLARDGMDESIDSFLRNYERVEEARGHYKSQQSTNDSSEQPTPLEAAQADQFLNGDDNA